jgi:hypothetical protein
MSNKELERVIDRARTLSEEMANGLDGQPSGVVLFALLGTLMSLIVQNPDLQDQKDLLQICLKFLQSQFDERASTKH